MLLGDGVQWQWQCSRGMDANVRNGYRLPQSALARRRLQWSRGTGSIQAAQPAIGPLPLRWPRPGDTCLLYTSDAADDMQCGDL
eukprot:4640778-Alexandrium_andersonii.AAC.1